MKYKTDAYLITCITNMHVGSGQANYGVVDNLVQRDSLTGIPIIHSSSLKGALREYFQDIWGENSKKLNHVFGPDPIRNVGTDNGVGNYKFFDADLITLPVRSNVRPFFRGTSKFMLVGINNKAAVLGVPGFDIIPFTNTTVENDKPLAKDVNSDCILEDYQVVNGLELKTGTNHIGENLALFSVDNFKELSKHLPVIARNQLDNGQSKNLWYEEVVPRESRFVFFVSKCYDNDIVTEDEFDNNIEKKVIQIGGNASIGYGFSKIKKIS